MCHRHSAFIMQATMGISEFPSGLSSTGSNMNRNRTRIIAILFLLCIRAVPQASAQIKHFEITADEGFLLCAREVLGKPVLEKISCGSPKVQPRPKTGPFSVE